MFDDSSNPWEVREIDFPAGSRVVSQADLLRSHTGGDHSHCIIILLNRKKKPTLTVERIGQWPHR